MRVSSSIFGDGIHAVYRVSLLGLVGGDLLRL